MKVCFAARRPKSLKLKSRPNQHVPFLGRSGVAPHIVTKFRSFSLFHALRYTFMPHTPLSTVPSRHVSEQPYCLTCSYPTSSSRFSSHTHSQIVDELVVECLNHPNGCKLSKAPPFCLLKYNSLFVNALWSCPEKACRKDVH